MVLSSEEYIQRKNSFSKYFKDKLLKSISNVNDKDFMLSMLIEEFEEGNLESQEDVLILLVNGSFPASMLSPLIENDIDDQSLEEILSLIDEGEDDKGFENEKDINEGTNILFEELKSLSENIF